MMKFLKSESQLTPLPLLGQSLPPTPQLQQLPPSASLAEAGSKKKQRMWTKGSHLCQRLLQSNMFLLKTQRTWTKGSHLCQQLLQSNMFLLLHIHRHQMWCPLLLKKLS